MSDLMRMKKGDDFLRHHLEHLIDGTLNLVWGPGNSSNGHATQAISTAMKPLKHQGVIVTSLCTEVPVAERPQGIGLLVIQPHKDALCWWWRFDLQRNGIVKVFGKALWDLRDERVRAVLKQGMFPPAGAFNETE